MAKTNEKKLEITTEKKNFKPISQARKGLVEKEQKKKMGRPKSTKKPKGYSVYLYEEHAELLTNVFGGSTPNDFFKALATKAYEDKEALFSIAKAVYGADSREAKLAKMELMDD